MDHDPHDLDRFVEAQEPVMADVEAELAAGRKRSHWMWFVFPQLGGLGRSVTARYYGISGLDEAAAYLAHPVLGPRLEHCTALVLAARTRPAAEILGKVDALKLRSSLTLFSRVEGAPGVFADTLAAFYPSPDAETLRLLDMPSGA